MLGGRVVKRYQGPRLRARDYVATDPLPSTSTRQSGRTTDDTLGFPDPTETLGDAKYGSWSSRETVTMSLPQPAAGSNSPTNLPTSSESSPRTSPQPVDRRPRGPPGSPRRRNPTIPGLRRGRMPGRAGMICVLHLCCSTSRTPVLLASERAVKKSRSRQHAGPGVSVLLRRKPPQGPRQQQTAIARALG